MFTVSLKNLAWKAHQFQQFHSLNCYFIFVSGAFRKKCFAAFFKKNLLRKQTFVDFDEQQNWKSSCSKKNNEVIYILRVKRHLLPKYFSFVLKDF
jgi:hypothetical protein